MLKKKKMTELKFSDSKEFDKSKDKCVEEFLSGKPTFKRKITQGLYWTAMDKDIANQYIRDERWLWGRIKFWDTIKVINHGVKEGKESTIGFGK